MPTACGVGKSFLLNFFPTILKPWSRRLRRLVERFVVTPRHSSTYFVRSMTPTRYCLMHRVRRKCATRSWARSTLRKRMSSSLSARLKKRVSWTKPRARRKKPNSRSCWKSKRRRTSRTRRPPTRRTKSQRPSWKPPRRRKKRSKRKRRNKRNKKRGGKRKNRVKSLLSRRTSLA